MRRALSIILILGLLVIGGGFVAQTAYQAGLSTAITTAVAGTDGVVVTPVVVPQYGYGYGYGWHGFGGPGFGFFGFLGFLLFAFLVIGVIRAIAFGGRGRGRGWGGPGGAGGPGGSGPGSHPWEGRARQSFDDWHRTAHQDPPRSTDPAE